MVQGYSANPLYKKLGLNEENKIKLINAPKNYRELIGNFYEKLRLKNKDTSDLDFIHFFTNQQSELEEQLIKLKKEISKNGMIWISWYKKSSGKKTELNENIIRETALALGLVDVKVCAIDEEWSGLKLVYRLKDR